MIAFHGSSSALVGAIRINERDSGWFGNGFYATSSQEYAFRWGKVLNTVELPEGNYAEVVVIGNYDKIQWLGLANDANENAGGWLAWMENEALYSENLTKAFVALGFIGVRIHFGENKDVEVVVFDVSTIKVLPN